MRSSPQDIVHAGFQPLEKKFEKKTPQPPQLTVSNDEAVGNGSRQAEWIASEEGPRASPLKSPSENLLSKKTLNASRKAIVDAVAIPTGAASAGKTFGRSSVDLRPQRDTASDNFIVI